jgi:N-methylhydantoinase A
MMIGVDIGGTFTDLVAVDGGELNFVKTLSTPQDPAKGVIEGLGLLAERVGSDRDTMLRRVNVFIHGTTVATNMLVQRTGAVLGLITTAGFRDLLELRDGTKRERYRLRLPPPVPLVPRELRKEVVERVRSNGDVETVLDEASVRAAIADLRGSLPVECPPKPCARTSDRAVDRKVRLVALHVAVPSDTGARGGI